MQSVGVDAIPFLTEPLAVTPGSFVPIGKFSYEYGVPAGGALVSEEGYETGKKAAPPADKILEGTSAGTIPVVSTDMHTEISYRAAQALGLDVPGTLLVQADEVIRWPCSRREVE
jgi:hypothetical protein